MKYRSDFVTNSSSSSFIVHFKTKKELSTAYETMLKDFYLGAFAPFVFSTIDSNKLSYKEVLYVMRDKLSNHKYSEMLDAYNTASKDLKKKYPSYNSFYGSPEYQEILYGLISPQLEAFKSIVNPRGIFSYFVYSDDSELGSKLEHDVMPDLPFVVGYFNNH